MLFRFSLYSFLRRQEYFAPFIILAFLQKGLSYTQLGLLICLREICINLMEIPSGAVADVLGRKKALVTSLISYVISFFIFGMADTIWWLIPGMVFYGIGEAFRTGTHKAMIFSWLSHYNREKEKTHVYGITRSWGKIGGMISVIPATLIVFYARDYSFVFFLSLIPFGINAINIATYPSWIDGEKSHEKTSLKTIYHTLKQSLHDCMKTSSLRKIIGETMCYESLFKLSKDYIQPVIKTIALSLPVFLAIADEQRTALILGLFHFIMNLAGAYTSRKAGPLVDKLGSPQHAGKTLWLAEAGFFILIGIGILLKLNLLIITGFLLILIKQNLWKPVLVSRCADICDKKQLATVLSIQSQAKAILLSVLAPVLGYFVDTLKNGESLFRFIPVAVCGLILSGIILIVNYRKSPETKTA